MINTTNRRRLDPVKTRETILTAALDVFAESGFEGASIADIAVAAQVPKSLLQYHFGSKEDLWNTCLDQKAIPALKPLDRFLESGDAASRAAFVEARFEVLRANPKVARMLAWASLGFAPLPEFLLERRERLVHIGAGDPSNHELTLLLFALASMDGWFLYRKLYCSALGDAVAEKALEDQFLQFLLKSIRRPDC